MNTDRRNFIKTTAIAAGMIGTGAITSAIACGKKNPIGDSSDEGMTDYGKLTAPENNYMRPRAVSNKNPLFRFKYVTWGYVPDDLKPFSAINVPDDEVFSANFEAYKNKNVGVTIQVENWNSFEQKPEKTAYLEELLKKYDNIIALTVVEQSCSNLNAEQQRRMITLINLCAKYNALFIWEDMGYPDRENVFQKAGDIPELFNAIKNNSKNIVLINKMNGWGQFFQTQALIMGYWQSGLCNAWGVNPEDFWWWEVGYTNRFSQSLGKKPGGVAMMNKTRYCVPDALIGQMVALTMIQGGCVFSFEHVDRVVQYKSKFVPCFTQVIKPLHDLAINEGIIPSKQQVKDQIKAAVYANNKDCQQLAFPTEELFRGLYGADEYSDDWIKTNGSCPEFIPSTGRYFCIPLIPKLALNNAGAVFPDIINSGDLSPTNKLNYFNSKYPQTATGNSAVLNVYYSNFITNPYENKDEDASFGNVSVLGKYTLSGKLPANTYIYQRQFGSECRLHINNFTVDTDLAIWNNPGFDAHGFLGQYVDALPGTGIASKMHTTTIMIGGLTDVNKVASNGGSVRKSASNGMVTLTISHNGTVDITIAP